MRIIKHGKPDGDQKHKIKCQGCGTVIEALTSELTRVTDQRDGDFWKIPCPVCPRLITKQVPRAVYY
jgi:ribosomal protein S27E